MAHSFTTDGKTLFVYNGDFSGDVTITIKTGEEFNVPVKDLLHFFRLYVESKKIEKIEKSSLNQLLDL